MKKQALLLTVITVVGALICGCGTGSVWRQPRLATAVGENKDITNSSVYVLIDNRSVFTVRAQVFPERTVLDNFVYPLIIPANQIVMLALRPGVNYTIRGDVHHNGAPRWKINQQFSTMDVVFDSTGVVRASKAIVVEIGNLQTGVLVNRTQDTVVVRDAFGADSFTISPASSQKVTVMPPEPVFVVYFGKGPDAPWHEIRYKINSTRYDQYFNGVWVDWIGYIEPRHKQAAQYP